jgi:hypothetical protein
MYSTVRHLRLFCAFALLATVLAACDDAAPAARPPARPATRTPAARPATRTPVPAGQKGMADWTILVYLDGDNDLESSAIDDFAEMASVGSSERVQILVQLDRIRSDEDWDDASNDNWGGTRRFRVTKGATPTKGHQADDIGEQNMGDPETLADFAAWGVGAYPARRYALIFWDHGASWPGIASDDTSDGDMLTLPELSAALEDVRDRTGGTTFDLLGFDACLMGQIDVLATVAPFGKVAIGSADLEPGEGWAWNKWLADLKRSPTQDAAAIAPSIIKSFMAFYKGEDDTVTLSAFDLTKASDLATRLDGLAKAMIAEMPRAYKAIGSARSQALEYAAGDKDISAIDLGSFTRALLEERPPQRVAAAARELDAALADARLFQGAGSDHANSTGISLYFPKLARGYDKSYADESPMSGSTTWDDFLQAFYRAGKGRSRSDVSKLTLAAPLGSGADPVTLSATVAGDDTGSVSYFIGQFDADDPDTLQLLQLDYLYPPNFLHDGSAPAWPAEPTEARLIWGRDLWHLSNGSEGVLAPFEPADYGADRYSVAGTYRATSKSRPIEVTLEFEVQGDEATLAHIWSFDKGSGDTVRPREIKPRAGARFTPSFATLTVRDGQEEVSEGERDGDEIVFGREPLTAQREAAPDGDYVVGLLVENHAGEISDQYADVTVGGTR